MNTTLVVVGAGVVVGLWTLGLYKGKVVYPKGTWLRMRRGAQNKAWDYEFVRLSADTTRMNISSNDYIDCSYISKQGTLEDSHFKDWKRYEPVDRELAYRLEKAYVIARKKKTEDELRRLNNLEKEWQEGLHTFLKNA